MTTTNSKFENDMTPLFRNEIKRNGILIRAIESESGHTYHVTLFEGHVSSCEQANGDPCQGWRYRHTCHHATLAMQLEAERDDERSRYNYYEMAIGA